MGDNTNNSCQFPYVWFKKNAGLLAQFLNIFAGIMDDNPGFPGASNTIYANCGAWVDSAKDGCTYVETEVVDGNLHVRLKGYQDDTPNPPKDFIKDEGSVQAP